MSEANFIFGPLSQSQVEQLSSLLSSQGLKEDRRGKPVSTPKDCISVSFGEGKFYTRIFESTRWLVTYPSSPVYKYQLANFEHSLEVIKAYSKRTTQPKIVEEATEILTLEKKKVIHAYKTSPIGAIRQLLEDLFGIEMFRESTFKVGQRLKIGGTLVVLAHLRDNMILLLDLNTTSALTKTIIVKDIENITKTELSKYLPKDVLIEECS